MWRRFVAAAGQTDSNRDRYVDFLRVFSIVSVVVGHWFMAVPHYENGEFRATNALSSVDGLWILTWVLQVMPVFFIVGGFSNFVTLRSMQSKGLGFTDYVVSRTRRIVRPVLVLLTVWTVVAVVLGAAGVSSTTVAQLTLWVTQPLWFVAVYLMVVLLAPVMLRLHAQHGMRVPICLIAGAAVIDTLRIGFGVAGVGYVNMVVVWILTQQLGFLYADGTLLRMTRREHAAIAVGGLTALALLVVVVGYPGSMVGQAGDKFSNMSPPTLAIVALTIWQLGLALLLRPAATRLLQRTTTWAAVIAGNTFAMTLYLWHLTALIIAVVVLFPLGLPQPDPGTTTWFMTRPLWFSITALPLAALVLTFSRFDGQRNNTPVPLPDTKRNRALAASGAMLISTAVLGLALTSLKGIGSLTDGRPLGNYEITSTFALAVLVLGVILIEYVAQASARAEGRNPAHSTDLLDGASTTA